MLPPSHYSFGHKVSDHFGVSDGRVIEVLPDSGGREGDARDRGLEPGAHSQLPGEDQRVKRRSRPAGTVAEQFHLERYDHPLLDFGRLLVVKEGRLLGMVTLKDMLDFLSSKVELEEV